MAATDLKLDDPGSLPRPGPIGRLLRFFPRLEEMACIDQRRYHSAVQPLLRD